MKFNNQCMTNVIRDIFSLLKFEDNTISNFKIKPIKVETIFDDYKSIYKIDEIKLCLHILITKNIIQYDAENHLILDFTPTGYNEISPYLT